MQRFHWNKKGRYLTWRTASPAAFGEKGYLDLRENAQDQKKPQQNRGAFGRNVETEMISYERTAFCWRIEMYPRLSETQARGRKTSPCFNDFLPDR